MRAALSAWLKGNRASAIVHASKAESPEAERLFELLEASNLDQLRPQLERALQQRGGELLALSPHQRLREISVPVLLLHGLSDTVIPATETSWASLELKRARGWYWDLWPIGSSRALITPLIEHISLEGGGLWLDKLRLIDLVARFL